VIESSAAVRGLVLVDVRGDGGPFAAALTDALAAKGWRIGRLTIDPAGVDEDLMDAAFDRALEASGEVDGLVLLAGTERPAVPLAASGPEDWERTLAAPLRAAFLALRRGLDEFLAGRGGRILLAIACPPAPGTIPATLSSGLVSLSRAVATEYGRRGIACNSLIVPAGAELDIRAAIETACFLLSEDAGYVTAEVVDLHQSQNSTATRHVMSY
jgi:NAD(P)-dependent dehydrogenase (short-subunit alcohol dehydrogenase family)